MHLRPRLRNRETHRELSPSTHDCIKEALRKVESGFGEVEKVGGARAL